VSSFNAWDWLDVSLSGLEEGWVVDVGGGIVPVVELASWGIKILPHLASLEDVAIGSSEHLGVDHAVGHLLHLGAGWPDVSEEDVLALLVLTERLGLEVEVYGTGQGVGNDERWGCEVVGSGVWVDTALEVSVTRQDGSSNQVVVDDAVLD